MNRTYLRHRSGWKGTAAWGIVLGVLVTAAAGVGFWYGRASVPLSLISPQMVPVFEAMLKEERKMLEAARWKSQAQLDVLSGRIGDLHAEILRLNALGGRLVEMAGLDAEEFDFESPPPLGGPADARVSNEIEVSELLREVTDLSGFINDRRHKLKQLEQMIMEKGLGKHAVPSGWPVRSGYITSGFGYRMHPILKKYHLHSGVDFAGKRGTPILATADGVVIFSGWESGYGRIVKIRHMNGLVTCYAHNQKNLVKKGDLVKKGQTIARLGSSGRSTGPHVHFEVRRYGKAINPMNYVGAKSYRKGGG
ncbi:M23 family metallopeptidase [Candidatus Thiosymbion oneisti]|uniref:M23 family metallopeptidase n=2 Tax=Candidatus Thiosymbion oneisti TaxID=589554 RepID=UPI001414F84C|nr:M23 family metallopeptidase [Candidatus Thiosymbion oneisti]